MRVRLGCLLATDRTGGAEADNATWLDSGGIPLGGESVRVWLPTTFHQMGPSTPDVASEGVSSAHKPPSVPSFHIKPGPFRLPRPTRRRAKYRCPSPRLFGRVYDITEHT